MKKILKYTTILFAIMTVTACNGNRDKTSKDNNNDYKKAINNEDYKKAVKENDFEKAHDILGEIYDNYEDVWNDNFPGLHYDNDKRSKIEVAATEYSRAASYILGAEVRYLISEKPDMANDRIEYLLNEIVILGEKVAEGTGYYPGGVPKHQQACAKFDCYKQTVKYNNEICDIILNLAVKNKNQDLAELAISHYLDNGVIIEEIIHNEGTIKYESTDRNKAIKKYEKAFGEYEGEDSEDYSKEDSEEDSDQDLDQDSDNSNIVKSKKSKHKRRK